MCEDDSAWTLFVIAQRNHGVGDTFDESTVLVEVRVVLPLHLFVIGDVGAVGGDDDGMTWDLAIEQGEELEYK